MQNKVLHALNDINRLAMEIVQPFETLTFQAEVLSGDLLTITASTDVSYINNFTLRLQDVVYFSGHLIWHWDNEYKNNCVELINPTSEMPILWDDCFLFRFNNVDLGIKSVIIMAKLIDIELE